MTITVERVLSATPEVEALVGELDAVLGAAYDAHQRHGLAIAQLFEPHLRFFLAWSEGEAVGCGGVALCADHAEVKRMYTRPAARGRGVASALLRRIEDEARAAGLPVLRLETGVRQPEAIALYQKSGFRRCGPFGLYARLPADRIEASLFYEKPLDAVAPSGGGAGSP